MKAMNNFGNNNRKQLEEQFKSKFENAQFAPPAHLWEQIDAALDAKPWYKRPLFYWTSGLVAALLLVVMFWFTLVYENPNTSLENTIVDSDKNKIENSIDRNNQKNKEIHTIQTPNKNNFAVTENNSIQDNDIINSNINSKNSDTNTPNFIDNSTTTQNKNSDVSISVIIKNDDRNTDRNNDKNKEQTNTDLTKNILAIENTNITIIDFKEIDWTKYLPVGNPYFQQEIIVKVDSTNETIADNKNNQNSTQDLKKSSGIALTFGINHTQGIYKPTFRTDSLHSGLTVIEAYSSNLADTLPQMNISGNYQQTGFDIALAFGKNNRWSINTGLGIGKANYAFNSTNYKQDTVFLGNDLIEFPNNKVEVNYEWTQIPIAIGYQFGESRAKKFSGFAQLGTAIEFLNNHSYISADPQFNYAIGTHQTTNTHVWTQVGINYHITNHFMLWGGGTYKSSLSSLINENGVTFSSQAYGWQVGTRFVIFKNKK